MRLSFVFVVLITLPQPLTDIFISNQQLSPSPVGKLRFEKPASTSEVAEDKENEPVKHMSPQKLSQLPRHETSDLGYQETAARGSPSRSAPPLPPRSPRRVPHDYHPNTSQQRNQGTTPPPMEDTKDTEDSFVSADEPPASKLAVEATAREKEQDIDNSQAQHVGLDSQDADPRTVSYQFSVSAETDAGMQEAVEHVENTSLGKADFPDKPSSPSETSSPERPIIRKKSSLNLASLPPRDPLTTKKSFGSTAAQGTARDSTRGFSMIRNSFLNRNKQSDGHDLTKEEENDLEVVSSESMDEADEHLSQQLDSSKMHNKTSTQRLHERINMLGKTNTSKPSKSNLTTVNATGASQKVEHAKPTIASYTSENNNKDEDWITPVTGIENNMNHSRGDKNFEPQNDVPEVPNLPTAPAKYSDLGYAAVESTTPAGSPSKWTGDGPLSASKAKFQSFLRSAKGMFASSAAASAQAKLETMSPGPSRAKNASKQPTASSGVDLTHPAGVSASSRKRSASQGPLRDDIGMVNEGPPSKRRSSQRLVERHATENDKAGMILSDQQLSVDAAKSTVGKAELDKSQHYGSEPAGIMQPPQRQAAKALDQANKPSEMKRPEQLVKANSSSKAKPGQISIMVPSMRPQFGANSTGPKASAPPGPPILSSSTTKPVLTKKASEVSMRSASSQSNRSGPANSKLKALENARRKKEQDEKEQQRKEEQKKALERKRAEKAEEERQAQEKKVAEQKREVEARVAAQKRAAVQQKAEKQQREEQLRAQAEAAKAKPANALCQSQNERLPAGQKTEKIPLRPESRGQEAGRPLIPHVNPAKPAKRYFNPDIDEQRDAPAPKPSLLVQQDPKKPKISEEFELRTQQQSVARPPMGPPMRPSVAKKQELPSKFPHGFTSTANPSQTGPSMLKTAVNNTTYHMQYSQNPKTPVAVNDMAKFANTRIPFAEAPNPPGPSNAQNLTGYGQTQRGFPKTPASAAVKSSPGFPNGDNISLPEIATDSEDEDSDAGFEAPDWTNSPELRQLLEQQQLVDPMKVFGPIAPLSMEEVFKGASKDRMKRFRDRTSSANWNGPDRLTEEERRRDREARERFEREGGWTYEGSLAVERAGR